MALWFLQLALTLNGHIQQGYPIYKAITANIPGGGVVLEPDV